MARETLAVDIDDVVAAHIPDFVEYSNRVYGTDLTVDTYTEDWSELWGVPFEEVLRRAKEFHKERLQHFEPIAEADYYLGKLAEKLDLIVVTARPKWNIDATHTWLDTHFKGYFTERHFVPIWEPGNTVTKGDICVQVGADYLLDDQPRHCNAAAELGVTALLYGEYQWRRDHKVHDDVIKVDDWQAVAEYFGVQS